MPVTKSVVVSPPPAPSVPVSRPCCVLLAFPCRKSTLLRIIGRRRTPPSPFLSTFHPPSTVARQGKERPSLPVPSPSNCQLARPDDDPRPGLRCTSKRPNDPNHREPNWAWAGSRPQEHAEEQQVSLRDYPWLPTAGSSDRSDHPLFPPLNSLACRLPPCPRGCISIIAGRPSPFATFQVVVSRFPASTHLTLASASPHRQSPP